MECDGDISQDDPKNATVPGCKARKGNRGSGMRCGSRSFAPRGKSLLTNMLYDFVDK